MGSVSMECARGDHRIRGRYQIQGQAGQGPTPATAVAKLTDRMVRRVRPAMELGRAVSELLLALNFSSLDSWPSSCEEGGQARGGRKRIMHTATSMCSAAGHGRAGCHFVRRMLEVDACTNACYRHCACTASTNTSGSAHTRQQATAYGQTRQVSDCLAGNWARQVLWSRGLCAVSSKGAHTTFCSYIIQDCTCRHTIQT